MDYPINVLLEKSLGIGEATEEVKVDSLSSNFEPFAPLSVELRVDIKIFSKFLPYVEISFAKLLFNTVQITISSGFGKFYT